MDAKAAPPAPGGAMTPARGNNLLQRFDKNGDGRIDEDERIAAREMMLGEEVARQAARAAAAAATPTPAPAPVNVGAPAAPAASAKPENTVAVGPDGPRMIREHFDRNGDGRVDREEESALRLYAAERGFGADLRVRGELLQRFDQDGNSKLDEPELAALQTFQNRRAEGLTAMRENMLEDFDGDKNGQIQPLEQTIFENVIRRRIERNPGELFGADRDDNGRIDEPEWLDVRNQLRRVLATDPRVMTAAQEQARLDAVANEVARRLALREEAVGNLPSARAALPTDGMAPSPQAEQERLDRVAEEVRRRREARERATPSKDRTAK